MNELSTETLRTLIREREAFVLRLPEGSGRRKAWQNNLDALCAELGGRLEDEAFDDIARHVAVLAL